MKKQFLAAAVILSSLAATAQTYQGTVGRTLAESKEWWPEPVRPPQGAPNVLLVLLDDVGFGASSAFGGLISTPVFDSLAANGLRYTNFHTAAICAPTRAALLTGRNQHFVHMGGFAHYFSSAGFPGWDGRIPSSSGTIAEVLKNAGYNTFAVGKYGVTPDEDTSNAGPFDYWPSGKGFEHFFGFLGSQTDQYKPALAEDNVNIQPDGRHFSEQLTDKAISYIARQQKAAPGKPFFLYYAPAATHAPHQVPADWRDKYKGQFDEGWDVYRQKVFANQKKLGIIPANATLPARNARIKAWNSLRPDEQKLYARFFEVYAAYLTYTDYQVGRVINYLKSINQLDNTLIYVVIGDNGASKEGTDEGVVSNKQTPRGNKNLTRAALTKYNEENIALIGTPESDANYPLGWAQATNTPFKFWKQDAFAEGGTRNPLIVFYPKKITDKGALRTQYGYVTDILPTTLEVTGVPFPTAIKGIKQDTLQGTSLAYSFDNAKAPSRHTEQYYYIFGNRAVYKDGWKAAAAHHPDYIDLNEYADTKHDVQKDFDKDEWELYNLDEDFNEQNNLAKKYPEKLAELKKQFEEDAKKYNIYPLIDWEDVFTGKLINAKKVKR
ncbi:sulfatase-like hydrolase/transferase [Chitinophaga sp. LS1]|uniref:sulfatase-like hydrolase/transferase n=1 Tax=Chitinophaga sp. LS1 TaxID=3051176 RepID=UPI002AAA9C04|nr:sulfatase-like hydrolase/transferase [Chitinophaga sp. LS1]WPV64081.1 sulfatase-like hydrolase/transferase [Chitinophaga sp. LS1]